MLKAIARLLGRLAPRRADRTDELRLAVAALLVEVAGISGNFDDRGRKTLERLLASRFSLSPEGATALLAAAEDAVRRSTEMTGFAGTVTRAPAPEDRSQVVGILWQAAYAGGRPDAVQDALLRRIASLIGVGDADRVQARRNALRYDEQGAPA